MGLVRRSASQQSEAGLGLSEASEAIRIQNIPGSTYSSWPILLLHDPQREGLFKICALGVSLASPYCRHWSGADTNSSFTTDF